MKGIIANLHAGEFRSISAMSSAPEAAAMKSSSPYRSLKGLVRRPEKSGFAVRVCCFRARILSWPSSSGSFSSSSSSPPESAVASSIYIIHIFSMSELKH